MPYRAPADDDWPAGPAVTPYLLALAAGAVVELGALAVGIAHASSLADLALIAAPVALLFGLRNPTAIVPAYLFISQFKTLPWLSGLPFNLSVLFGVYLAGVAGFHLLRGRRWSPDATSIVLFTLLVVLALQAYQRATMVQIAQLKLMYLATFVSVSFLAPMALFTSRRRVESFLRWMVATVVAMAALMFGLAAANPDAYVGERMGVAGSAPIPTGLAMMLGLVACLLWWLPRARTLPQRLGAAAAAAICLLGALATGSRGPLLFGLLAIGIGAVLYAWNRTGRVTGIALRAAVVGACALAVMVVIAQAGLADRIPGAERAMSVVTGSEDDISDESRVPLMLTAARMVGERPLLGHGLGAYHKRIGRTDGGDYYYPHNMLLDIACEAGLPAALLLLVLLGRLVWRLLRPALSDTAPVDPAVIATLALLLTVALESMVSLDFFRARATWGLAGISAAVGTLVARGALTPEAQPAPGDDDRRATTTRHTVAAT